MPCPGNFWGSSSFLSFLLCESHSFIEAFEAIVLWKRRQVLGGTLLSILCTRNSIPSLKKRVLRLIILNRRCVQLEHLLAVVVLVLELSSRTNPQHTPPARVYDFSLLFKLGFDASV